MTKQTNQWAIKTLVSDEVYTDRKYFLDYFYKIALEAQSRRTMSTVLLGQRRMGKTEIFKRVVNRLFFEQDHTNPNAVVPGANTEIDVHGGAGIEQWIAESKWHKGGKIGIQPIKQLLDKAKVVKKELDADVIRIWFFGHDGFTKKAETLMRENGIFWSTREDLDGLLEHVKLRRLPTF